MARVLGLLWMEIICGNAQASLCICVQYNRTEHFIYLPIFFSWPEIYVFVGRVFINL